MIARHANQGSYCLCHGQKTGERSESWGIRKWESQLLVPGTLPQSRSMSSKWMSLAPTKVGIRCWGLCYTAIEKPDPPRPCLLVEAADVPPLSHFRLPNTAFICLLGQRLGHTWNLRKSGKWRLQLPILYRVTNGREVELCEPCMISLSPSYSAVSFPTIGKGPDFNCFRSPSTLQSV